MIFPYSIDRKERKFALGTYVLIGLNTICFVATLFISAGKKDIFFMQFGFVPEDWMKIYPFVTSMFLHGGWMHLIGNMYYLWLFGRGVEDRLGTKKYIVFYLISGVIAALAHKVATPDFFHDLPCVGASGAISGVLGAFMVIAPLARVRCFYLWVFFIRPLYGKIVFPTILFLGGWFFMQLMYGLSFSSAVGAVGVAFWAHIGGFVCGAVVIGASALRRHTKDFIRQYIYRNRFARALRSAKREDWPGAAAGLERLVSYKTGSSDTDVLLARMYFQMGDTPKAEAWIQALFQDAICRKDNARIINAYYLLAELGRSKSLAPRDYLLLGRGFVKYKKKLQAAGAFLEGFKRFPNASETSFILYELGDLCRQEKNYESARQVYELFLSLYPGSKLYTSAEYCLEELKEQQQEPG